MRSLLALVIPVAMLLAASPAHAASSVTLELHLGDASVPAYATCAVSVTTPTDGAAVLNAAVASGCLKGWSYESFPGLGRYVTCIDDGHANLCQDPAGGLATAWLYDINGVQANGGVDDGRDAPVGAGDVVQFVYTNWIPSCGVACL